MAIAAKQVWKCINPDCGKNFGVGEWTCIDGVSPHVVESKRFFMDDAPTVPARINGVMTIDKHSGTLVLNIPPERRSKDAAGVEIVIPGGQVQFIRGVYETANAEEQYWLTKHRGMCTEERWREVYFNEDEKRAIERMEMAAERTRLESERNSLLADIQQMRTAQK